MKRIYSTFFHCEEIVELRAIGVQGNSRHWTGYAKGIISGYFNNTSDLAKCAETANDAGAKGVYFCLNPANSALLARAFNRLVVPEHTTKDSDISCIRWFPLDLDPVRPAGVSSTDTEMQLAIDLGNEIMTWLEEEKGFPRGIRAMSGNGFHGLYRLPDLPNNDETHDIIVRSLAAITSKFKNEFVTIDAKVCNPARLWKYYGTTGRKGDPTPDRPHRLSRLGDGQPSQLDEIPSATLEVVKELADLIRRQVSSPSILQEPPNRGGGHAGKKQLGPVHMDKYLTNYGISFREKKNGDRPLYLLERCLFNADHGPWQASIVAPVNGPLSYQCFHDSCANRTWKEARKLISGERSIAEFCHGYDPDWAAGENIRTGPFREESFIDILPDEDGPVLRPDGELVPSPSQVDWREFYVKNRREEFVPRRLVTYLQKYNHPLAYTSKQFWKYQNGVWKAYSEASIRRQITRALKDKIQGRMTDNVFKVLADSSFIDEDRWDQTPMLINCQTGMLNILTNEVIPHDPKYLNRVQLPVKYDPHRESLRWFEFLKSVFPEDFADPTDTKNYMTKHYLLQQWFGYCLLRDNRFHRALILLGSGSNGKSTTEEVLQAMIGEENTSNLSLTDLSQRFKVQFLQGKMVNLAGETNTKDPIATEVFKTIVAGDRITAERKFGDIFNFRPYVKFCVSMNDAPIMTDRSYGFERRLIILAFNRRIEKNEIIPNMADQIIEEIDGVFTWAVRGLRNLLDRNGFYLSERVEDDTAQFMKTINPFLIFCEECCDLGSEYSEHPQRLWEKYKTWCEDGRNRPLGRNNFYNQIMSQYPSVTRDRTETTRLFRGIRLKPA